VIKMLTLILRHLH